MSRIWTQDRPNLDKTKPKTRLSARRIEQRGADRATRHCSNNVGGHERCRQRSNVDHADVEVIASYPGRWRCTAGTGGRPSG